MLKFKVNDFVYIINLFPQSIIIVHSLILIIVFIFFYEMLVVVLCAFLFLDLEFCCVCKLETGYWLYSVSKYYLWMVRNYLCLSLIYWLLEKMTNPLYFCNYVFKDTYVVVRIFIALFISIVEIFSTVWYIESWKLI